jgi:flagellar basal body rod protein FlgG
MIYGLYLSAAGVLTSSYRQDVIANNLANSETVGFKKDLPLFQQRLTEAQQRRLPRGANFPGAAPFPTPLGSTNPLLEPLGGGTFAHPTVIDTAQGELEPTGSPLDAAIEGKGYFAVDDGGQTRLTRNGQFAVDREGRLILSNENGQPLLDTRRQPIRLDPTAGGATIGSDGTVTQRGQPVAQLGVFDVADASRLVKQGATLLRPGDQELIPAANVTLHSESLERANVDPATELAALMDTQRQLEANANMIRYQDQTLSKLVNEVGKIG